MGSAPSIERLEHWTLIASDVERTRSFYTDVMGAQIPNRTGGPVSVVLAGTIIDIFPTSEQAKPSPGPGNQHHAYIIKLEEYDRWVAQFKQHNVPTRLSTHGLHRMSIWVDDPDGYHIELTVPFESDAAGAPEIAKRGLTPARR